MHSTRSLIPLAAAALALTAAAPAVAQAPIEVTVKVPAKVRLPTLTKVGVPAKISCSEDCSYSATLAGPTIGVVTSHTVKVPGGTTKTFRFKATRAQASELEKGDKLSVTLNAGSFMDPAVASDSFRVK